MSDDGQPDDSPAKNVPTRLVKRAVRASDLHKDARHIMHVLAEIADYKTSELPPRFTPSTSQIARETGMSESTVKRRRRELEEAGWILLRRPTPEERARHVRIKYQLAIPEVGVHRDHAEAAERLAHDLADASGTVIDPESWYQADPRPGFTVNPPDRSVWIPGGVSLTPDQGSHRPLEVVPGVRLTPLRTTYLTYMPFKSHRLSPAIASRDLRPPRN